MNFLYSIFTLAVGFAVGFFYRERSYKNQMNKLAQEIINSAQNIHDLNYMSVRNCFDQIEEINNKLKRIK